MVPRRGPPLTPPRRRAIAAFLVAATIVWWHARADGVFYVVGLEEPLASTLGPLLPALSAGLLVSMALSVVDAAAGPIAGVVAAGLTLALPAFLPLHRASLAGPPLAAITVMMLSVMVRAPRFSVAYGTLAATAAVFVDPAGAGLPLAAAGWGAMVRRPGGNGASRRVAFALAPLLVAIVAAIWLGHAWPGTMHLGWRGHLDQGLRAGGAVIGDQIAPTLGSGTLRWLAIADTSLLMLAVVASAWLIVARRQAIDAPLRRIFPAIVVLLVALAAGLSLRWLLLPASPLPDAEAVFPIAVLVLLGVVTGVAALWRIWPRWGRVIAVLLIVGWLQAALRA